MQLISVNVGKEHPIRNGKPTGTSGIFKLPVTTSVEVTLLGLAGDVIIDTRNHGGADQAVYVFGSTDYEWWSKELEREIGPGTFGDNLTISDLESAALNIGDRLRVGAVLLEVTSPRIPCATLAARMDDPKFVKRFRKAERPGLYCRVIEAGAVQAGDPVTLIRYTGDPVVPALELFRGFYDKDADEDDFRRWLAAPVAIRNRQEYEAQLTALVTD